MKMRKSTHLWREEDHPRDEEGKFCKSNHLGEKINDRNVAERTKYIEYKANRELINSEEYRKKFEIEFVPKKVQNTLCKVAREIIKKNDGTKFESYAHIDSLGNIIKTERLGEFGGVVDIDCLNDCPDNSIYTIHNHPGSSSSSLDDIKFLLTSSKICAMIITGHQGNVYAIHRRKGETLSDFYKIYSITNVCIEEERVMQTLKKMGIEIKEM